MKLTVKEKVLVAAVTIAALLVMDATEGAAVRRSDDPESLEVVVEQLSSQMSSLQGKLTAVENTLQQLQAAENRKVAFTASISQTHINAAPGQIIPFSHVITNVGNAYDANTGAFTAPYGGQYMLFVSVDVSHDYRGVYISKNGYFLIPGHNDGDDHHIVAGGMVTLSEGDEITINHGTTVVGLVDGGPEAIFSGFKI